MIILITKRPLQPCPIPTASKKNATLVPDSDTASEIQPGATLTVKCHSRYQIRAGQSEETVKCVAANTYNPPAPVCQGSCLHVHLLFLQSFSPKRYP